MTVAPNGVCGTEFFNFLYGSYLVLIFLAVDRAQFAMLETETYNLRFCLYRMLKICAFRQSHKINQSQIVANIE